MRFLSKITTSLIVLLFAYQVSAGDKPLINYVGFNALKSEDKAKHKEAFIDYIAKLTPIMKRYGMGVRIYEVVYAPENSISADYVTFGDAADPETFQKFFADAEFQKIFPILVGAMDKHNVVFTDDVFAPDRDAIPGHTLLMLSWFEGDKVEAFEALTELFEAGEHAQKRHGARLIGIANGVNASSGLTDDIKVETAPDMTALWSIDDAHGFFEDEEQVALSKMAESYIAKQDAYWLKKVSFVDKKQSQ